MSFIVFIYIQHPYLLQGLLEHGLFVARDDPAQDWVSRGDGWDS